MKSPIPPEGEEKRAVYGTAGCCLHCLVWDVINKHAPDNPQGGGLLYDPELILGNLVDVMAELIAGIPSLPQRKQFFRLVDTTLRAQTARNLAKGNHPEAKPMRRQ